MSTSSNGEWRNNVHSKKIHHASRQPYGLMLPRELRWEEVATNHKWMTQCLAWAGVIIMYHVKYLRNDIVRFIRHYINGLLLLLLLSLLLLPWKANGSSSQKDTATITRALSSQPLEHSEDKTTGMRIHIMDKHDHRYRECYEKLINMAWVSADTTQRQCNLHESLGKP